MIVTRQRRKPFPWKRLILPIVAIALVIFAFTWGPSRTVIAKGPMAPLWQVTGSTFDKVTQPFHFAAQNQELTDRNRQITSLQKQVSELQAKASAKDKQIADLNTQIQQLQSQAAAARGASPTAAPAAGGQTAGAAGPAGGGTTLASSTTSGEDLTRGATPDMRRTAQYWANMEPANVAKVVQNLPVHYVAQILSLMSPDTVGAILDVLPPKYVAELTQEYPSLKR